jgi:hypothetical protein
MEDEHEKKIIPFKKKWQHLGGSGWAIEETTPPILKSDFFIRPDDEEMVGRKS